MQVQKDYTKGMILRSAEKRFERKRFAKTSMRIYLTIYEYGEEY